MVAKEVALLIGEEVALVMVAEEGVLVMDLMVA